MFEGKISCDTCGASTPLKSYVGREAVTNELAEIVYVERGSSFYEIPVPDGDNDGGFIFRHFCSKICLQVEASKRNIKDVEPIKKEEMN
jgi:hypothetical protein